jgi:hypothetical protein
LPSFLPLCQRLVLLRRDLCVGDRAHRAHPGTFEHDSQGGPPRVRQEPVWNRYD